MNAFKILKTQKYKKIDDKFIQWEKNFKWYQPDRKETEENNNDERNKKKLATSVTHNKYEWQRELAMNIYRWNSFCHLF